MDYNNNRYLVCTTATLHVINEAYLIGNTKQWARPNLLGTHWVVEVEPSSTYYNASFAMDHAQTLVLLSGPEWSMDEEQFMSGNTP